jgi:hypothetical protein
MLCGSGCVIADMRCALGVTDYEFRYELSAMSYQLRDYTPNSELETLNSLITYPTDNTNFPLT